MDKIGKASKEKKVMSFGMKFLMERPGLFNTALKFAPVVNHLPRFMVYNGLNAWGDVSFRLSPRSRLMICGRIIR